MALIPSVSNIIISRGTAGLDQWRQTSNSNKKNKQLFFLENLNLKYKQNTHNV